MTLRRKKVSQQLSSNKDQKHQINPSGQHSVTTIKMMILISLMIISEQDLDKVALLKVVMLTNDLTMRFFKRKSRCLVLQQPKTTILVIQAINNNYNDQLLHLEANLYNNSSKLLLCQDKAQSTQALTLSKQGFLEENKLNGRQPHLVLSNRHKEAQVKLCNLADKILIDHIQVLLIIFKRNNLFIMIQMKTSINNHREALKSRFR